MEPTAKLRSELFSKLDPDALSQLELKNEIFFGEIDAVIDLLLEGDFPHWSQAVRCTSKNAVVEQITAMSYQQLADEVREDQRFDHPNLMRDWILPGLIACVLSPFSFVWLVLDGFDNTCDWLKTLVGIPKRPLPDGAIYVERPPVWKSAQRLVANYWREKREGGLCCAVEPEVASS